MKRRRRGTTAMECAVVYPVAMMLVLGTIAVGVGNFQYEQLQSLAREGARYASVRSPNQSDCPEAQNSDVQTYVQSLSAGLQGLTCDSSSPDWTTTPGCVSVTLTYTWTPGAFFGPMTWTATSTMPVTH